MNTRAVMANHAENLLSLKLFTETYPTFSEGSLRWTIFKFRKELITAQAICYCGKRVLIHPNKFINFILEGKANTYR